MSARHAGPHGPISIDRDLASEQLWHRSLARSRQRRRLTEDTRRRAPRRKGASLAVTAAMVVGPAAPTIAGAASGGGGQSSGETAPGDPLLLHYGDTGNGVAALQQQLNRVLPRIHLAVDGRFGPQTGAAVVAYQRARGLRPTGQVDAQTWEALFPKDMVVANDGSATDTSNTSDASSASLPSDSSGDGGGSGSPLAAADSTAGIGTEAVLTSGGGDLPTLAPASAAEGQGQAAEAGVRIERARRRLVARFVEPGEHPRGGLPRRRAQGRPRARQRRRAADAAAVPERRLGRPGRGLRRAGRDTAVRNGRRHRDPGRDRRLWAQRDRPQDHQRSAQGPHHLLRPLRRRPRARR